MASTEIVWRTHLNEVAGVTVHTPDKSVPDRVRLVIGLGPTTVRIPPDAARVLAQALLDAASARTEPAPAPRVIPIHVAPIQALYHEPEDESHA